MTVHNFISFAGIFVLAGVAWLCSSDRKVVNARVVLWGIGLELLVAFFIFVVPAGRTVFLWANDAVTAVLGTATAGTRFVFGRLALPPGAVSEAGETSLGYFLAFQGLPTIIFFAALLGALYYLGIMPFFVRLFARLFSRSMRISGAEALSVSANIFVGVESSLVVRPHLQDMTRSELGTIITAGMGTIASTVLAHVRHDAPEGHPDDRRPPRLGLVHLGPGLDRHGQADHARDREAADPGRRRQAPLRARGQPHHGHHQRGRGGAQAPGRHRHPADRLPGAPGPVQPRPGLGRRAPQRALRLARRMVARGLPRLSLLPPDDRHGRAAFRRAGHRQDPRRPDHPDRGLLVRTAGRRSMSTGALKDPRSAIIASYALCGFAHVASLAIFIGGTGALVRPGSATCPASASGPCSRRRWPAS
ncbi:MAG: hypothetical protein MZU91_07885 [Desulfosudis oleivorans]|nr:hypothetical protein [Desulfosudis oleivorans]